MTCCHRRYVRIRGRKRGLMIHKKRLTSDKEKFHYIAIVSFQSFPKRRKTLASLHSMENSEKFLSMSSHATNPTVKNSSFLSNSASRVEE